MAAHTHSRHASAHRGRSAPPGVPSWAAAALLGLGPVVGAVLGEALGAYDGTVFALVCVASAAAAAVMVSPAGLWWAVPTPPPVIWAVSVLAELGWHDPPYQGSRGQAVGVAHGTIHAFPVMAAVEFTLAIIVVVRLAASGARRGRAAHV
jgi:hypothetical protein